MENKSPAHFIVVFLGIFLLLADARAQPAHTNANHYVQLVFTSDLHFGLTKEIFRTKANVPAADVNAAMVDQINMLHNATLPADSGILAGQKINGIDALVITGDIANREEKGLQASAISWMQFREDYVRRLHIKTSKGRPALLLITPGNHDASNAIGYHKPMEPVTDGTAITSIFNMMMHPAITRTPADFNYRKDKIHYSKNIRGIHFMFVNLWPDSSERRWMEKDLQQQPENIPVFIFTHSIPDAEARFFTNPNNDHSINATDLFENLVPEVFKDGVSIQDKAIIEQRALVSFLKRHKNIKAYFHGHNNFSETYDWKGPDQDIALHCFRADSPMKGKLSAKDETKLSFQLITIDTISKVITARECLWNAQPAVPGSGIEWGAVVNVSYK
jgi:hypothetical protein